MALVAYTSSPRVPGGANAHMEGVVLEDGVLVTYSIGFSQHLGVALVAGAPEDMLAAMQTSFRTNFEVNTGRSDGHLIEFVSMDAAGGGPVAAAVLDTDSQGRVTLSYPDTGSIPVVIATVEDSGQRRSATLISVSSTQAVVQVWEIPLLQVLGITVLGALSPAGPGVTVHVYAASG